MVADTISGQGNLLSCLIPQSEGNRNLRARLGCLKNSVELSKRTPDPKHVEIGSSSIKTSISETMRSMAQVTGSTRRRGSSPDKGSHRLVGTVQ
jgi:hypothetical protein